MRKTGFPSVRHRNTRSRGRFFYDPSTAMPHPYVSPLCHTLYSAARPVWYNERSPVLLYSTCPLQLGIPNASGQERPYDPHEE